MKDRGRTSKGGSPAHSEDERLHRLKSISKTVDPPFKSFEELEKEQQERRE